MDTAYIFPGQGSQYVGMAHDLVANYPVAKATFDEADAALGTYLSQLCFSGPDNVLTETINAQPAILTHSIAALRVIQSLDPDAAFSFVAGHSLGEYSALVAADVMDFADGVRLLRERGRVMKAAGDANPGMMAAILGLDLPVVEEVCRDSGAQISNHNAPGQLGISGSKADMERAITLAKERGARRVVPLAISIAAHSRWMERAAQEFNRAVQDTPMREPKFPVISNVTALPIGSVDEIRHELVTQLTVPVQWVKSVEYMVERSVTHFVEVGPKDVLAGLVRRINKDVHAVSIGDVASVKAFVHSKS